MSHNNWKALAPYLAPYFDTTLHDNAVLERFWIAEDGFSNGRSFETIEEATADVKSRLCTGVQYQIYDNHLHEWVCNVSVSQSIGLPFEPFDLHTLLLPGLRAWTLQSARCRIDL
jgi:hypothetical protein